jgi:hypothetical protein
MVCCGAHRLPGELKAAAPRGGGTLILSGSPRLLTQQDRQIPASQRLGSLRETIVDGAPFAWSS